MRTLFVILLGFVAFAGKAQVTQKIGYADWNYIFGQLPDAKQIENEEKTHRTQLENQLKAKYTEFQTKMTALQNLPATTPDAVKKDKEAELQTLQEGIQKFTQDAEFSLQKKHGDLMQPVLVKVSKAIETVAKENDYTFIINSQVSGGEDVLLYWDEKFNVSDLVLKKLGITPAAAANTPPNK